MFRTRKHIWQFPVFSQNHRITLQERMMVVQMKARDKYMWNTSAGELDAHALGEGRIYTASLIKPKSECKLQFLQIT